MNNIAIISTESSNITKDSIIKLNFATTANPVGAAPRRETSIVGAAPRRETRLSTLYY